MQAQDVIGWAASVILVATIGTQIVRQWREGSSKGVSRWLFIGQMAASAAFTVYSAMVGNTIFIITNAVMLVSAAAGLLIVLHHRRREGSGPAAASS